MQTPVTVTMARWSGGADGSGIEIHIIDERSRGRIQIALTLDQFAMALTSGTGAGTATWPGNIGIIGQRFEFKEVNIPRTELPGSRTGRGEAVVAAVRSYLQPLCVDGWQIHTDGSRSRQDGDTWNASLCRYVPHTEAGEGGA